MPLFTAPPKSLCILRLSAIGDVCHALAAVQAIQNHWPTTKITWITGKVEAQLLEGLDGIELIIFDKSQGLKGMQQVWQQLTHIKFDALVHMQAALRASMLSLGIKAKHRIGFSKNRTREGQWYFTNKHLPNTNAFHVLDNFMEFAFYLGVPKIAPQWQFPIPQEAINYADELMTRDTLVISPSASKTSRNWLTERYAKIAFYAHELGLNVALCGSPASNEVELCNEIESRCDFPTLNLAGKTSLKQLAAVLQRARVVLSPDSGPAHLASSLGVPVIGLYAHSNPRRTGPYSHPEFTVNVYDQHIFEQTGKDWQQLTWGTRAKGDNLMTQISVNSVKVKLQQALRLSSGENCER